jgi:hypothetical protein
MLSRKRLLAIPFLLSAFAYNTAIAQDETDALRYSATSVNSTARSMGLGGAVGALGADFSSLSVNPAGIGVYRRSEFTFTPSIKINGSNSAYQGTTTSDNASRFNVNNLGVVFTSTAEGKRYERSKWKSVSFGIGFNRIADFNRNYTYGGYQATPQGPNDTNPNRSSGAEVFSIDANKYPNDVFNASSTLAFLGYQSYLLDTFQGSYFPVTFYTTGVNQQRIVSQKGGMNDVAISLGGNYDEKLMLGVTVGIPTIRYKREITYTEKDATNNPNNYFDNFKYTESLFTHGSGINLKLGFIYKPVESFRFGVSFHTPSYFSLKDEQDRTLSTNTENFKTVLGALNTNPNTEVKGDKNLFDYNYISPWRTIVSAAGIFGKFGFISADYEYVDYASAQYSFDLNYSDYQAATNKAIKAAYKGASNLRVGLEGRIEHFSLRIGFNYMGSPYKNTNINGQQTSVSGGVGFRFDNMFFDLGMVHSLTEAQEQPYALNYAATTVNVPTAVTKYTLNNIALTFGVKF